MKFCPKCNKEYDDELMFCFHCGEKLQEKLEIEEDVIEQSNIEQIFCPYCGEKIDLDSNFCGFCGKSVHYEKKNDKLNNLSVPANDVKKTNRVNVSYVKPKKNNQIKKEEKEESTIISGAKFFAYAIGMFVLWFIFKVLIKGGVNILRNDGFGLPFIIILVLACCVLYFMLYRDSD